MLTREKMDGMPMAMLERLYFTAVTCVKDLNDKLEGQEGFVNLLFLEPDLVERRDKLEGYIEMLRDAMAAPRNRLQRAALDDVADPEPTGVIRL